MRAKPVPAEMIRVLRFQGADLKVFGAHQELRVPVVVHILAMPNIMLAMTSNEIYPCMGIADQQNMWT